MTSQVTESKVSKDNQTMNFGQFIEQNMKKKFLKKSYTKFVRETICRSFSKNWAYHWINSLKF